MAVVQRTGAGSKPRISRVVSKSDSNHGTATMAHRTLGLTPAGTICHSNLSLSYYPIHSTLCVLITVQSMVLGWLLDQMEQSSNNIPDAAEKLRHFFANG